MRLSSFFWLYLLIASFSSGQDRGSASSHQACLLLQDTLTTDVVQMPGSADYTNATQFAWNAYNTKFAPSCIIFPRQSSDVQESMKVIFTMEINYAVQAGGHSAMKGWNNVQDGILIMFTYMTAASYNPERDTITLLPGAIWGEAIDALEPYGVAAVGGRVPDVGTGFFLGGGLSFLSPKYGYGADTYVELDVVLVNGTLVTARGDNEYSDLFKALKGGTNRFGIVTRYEVQAIHTGGMDDTWWFGGSITYPEAGAEDLLRATARFARYNKDPDAVILSFIGHFVLPDTTHTVLTLPIISLFYNGGPNRSPTETEALFNATFSNFLQPSIPSSTPLLQHYSYAAISHLLDEGPNPKGKGQFFGGSAFSSSNVYGNDEEARYIQAYQTVKSFTEQFKSYLNSTVLAFTPILDSQIQAGRQNGGNAIDPPLGGWNAVQYQVTVQDLDVNLTELNGARQEFFERFPPDAGLPLYINECDKTQKVFETYGQYEFLKDTYVKYDPSRFNIRHTDGPLGL